MLQKLSNLLSFGLTAALMVPGIGCFPSHKEGAGETLLGTISMTEDPEHGPVMK